jgi:hypothetical protein
MAGWVDSRRSIVGAVHGKRASRCGCLMVVLAGMLAGLLPCGQAEILNDGRSTGQLTRLANLEETMFGSTTILSVDAGGSYLVAEQIDTFSTPYPELRTVWYARNGTATGAVYRVSAEFRPAAVQVRRQGGVMGWIDRTAGNGLVFKLVPASGGEGQPASFQVAHVDFTALTPEDNENLLHLYNLDGTPAGPNLESAWSPLGAEYRATEFVRLELSFEEPTGEDLEAVTNGVVSARVIARAWQLPEAEGEEEALGRPIELLTTLARPDSGDHRMGYFGVWASGFFPGGVIGHYRNLEAAGAIVVQTNLPPDVILVRPVSGSSFDEPASILIEANATDPDGTVTQVEFFEGGTSLGMVTEPPFTLNWTGVLAGQYTLTAVATDDQGETATSEPVTVSVVPWTGTEPILVVEPTPDGSLVISWTETGFQLQYKEQLDDPVWIDVPDTTNVSSVTLPVESGARYFRLVRSTAPPGPSLSIARSGANLVVTWPAGLTGYRLQSTDSLTDPVWMEIETTGNEHVQPIAGAGMFYRLIQP